MLLATERQERQKELVAILRLLNNSTYDSEDVIRRFNDIYKKDFRHSYSEIFQVIAEAIRECPAGEENLLIKNLGEILKTIDQEKRCDEKTKRGLFKLWDHVNLETARFQYLTNGPESRIKDISRKSDELERKLNNMQESAQSSAHQMQREFVSILGIFAAIIIAFFGGMNFIASAVASMKENNVAHVVLVTTIAALAMSNAIFLMMCYIGRLIGQKLAGWYIVFLNIFLILLPIIFIGYRWCYQYVAAKIR